MRHLNRKPFPHRRNQDGSFDSICLECFATVATESIEADLQAAESAHDCKGFNLSNIMHSADHQRRPNRSRQPALDESQGA
jgi:hypothetical protein